jgi:hypothetical protein
MIPQMRGAYKPHEQVAPDPHGPPHAHPSSHVHAHKTQTQNLLPTSRTRAPTKAALDGTGGSWPAHEWYLKIDQGHRAKPPSTYDCDAPFCRARPLRRPSTYDTRPTHTLPTDRREPLPHLNHSVGWQTPPRGVGRRGDGPVAGAAINARTQGAGRPREKGKARAHRR